LPMTIQPEWQATPLKKTQLDYRTTPSQGWRTGSEKWDLPLKQRRRSLPLPTRHSKSTATIQTTLDEWYRHRPTANGQGARSKLRQKSKDEKAHSESITEDKIIIDGMYHP
jgi:hypothetical protein